MVAGSYSHRMNKMPFIEIHGFNGKIFIPEKTVKIRKHNCMDCYECQMCSDERCEACLKSHCKMQKKEDDGSFCGY